MIAELLITVVVPATIAAVVWLTLHDDRTAEDETDRHYGGGW